MAGNKDQSRYCDLVVSKQETGELKINFRYLSKNNPNTAQTGAIPLMIPWRHVVVQVTKAWGAETEETCALMAPRCCIYGWLCLPVGVKTSLMEITMVWLCFIVDWIKDGEMTWECWLLVVCVLFGFLLPLPYVSVE